MDKEFQDRVDAFVAMVHKQGGATNATSNHPGEYLISIANLPGIITKFEPLDDAIARLKGWEQERKK